MVANVGYVSDSICKITFLFLIYASAHALGCPVIIVFRSIAFRSVNIQQNLLFLQFNFLSCSKGWMDVMLCSEKCFLVWMWCTRSKQKVGRVENPKAQLSFQTVVYCLHNSPSHLLLWTCMFSCPFFSLYLCN